MGELSARNFGLLVAYLLPGFIALLGLGHGLPAVQVWLASGPGMEPSVGGFLNLTLASLAVGMVVSGVRWAALDSLHHATGIARASLDFSKLQANLAAYTLVVEYHYRYYQFYANTFVGVLLAYGADVVAACGWCGGFGWMDFGFVILEAVLFAASRDTLRRYYLRATQVLGVSKDSFREKSHDKRRRTTRRVGQKRAEEERRGDAGSESKEGGGDEGSRGEAEGGDSEVKGS